MDTKFIPKDHEESLYDFWEKNGYLKPKKGKPYTILMPPPNANASLHAGHGMYTIDDIMIRWKRIMGFASVWIPGMDHAGFETQYVYEKHLAKQKKSRMDFDRKTLYEDVFNFVKENSGLIYKQFKKLGFLADWERSVFTLDDNVVSYVYKTFKKMFDDGLIYRDEYIVNYCTHCGTSLAELEVKYVERKDPLYYINYGPFVLATVRPETKFGDTALAVNPKDKRYKKWVGKTVEVEGLLGKFKLTVIADDFVDPKFGTGVVKITPGHDPNDYLAGKRHNLEVKKVIDINGRLTDVAGPYAGLKVRAAREKVVHDLKEKGLMDRIDNEYVHSVSTCYKCGRDLEPLTVPNWFIKVDSLKEKVVQVVISDKVQFIPKRYKKQILAWLEIMHDWPISRQIVWGIRIPVWYKIDGNEQKIVVNTITDEGKQFHGTIDQLLNGEVVPFRGGNKESLTLDQIKKGLQQVIVPEYDVEKIEFEIGTEEPSSGNWIQETSTFDTWFSSGQWPLVTLKGDEYQTRFPTDFMGTLADILKFWISRMIMFSLYLKNEVPFKHVYLWSMVADAKGVKMSKSKGNVINPIDLVDKYGADAFRATLLFGIGDGGTVNLSEDKVRAMRNFANKIWNIGRFILINKKTQTSKNHTERDLASSKKIPKQVRDDTLRQLKTEFASLEKEVTRNMEKYKFSRAFDSLYEFLWHRYADFYIEELKEGVQSGNISILESLEEVYLQTLKLLHPFIPFVTEAVWQEFRGNTSSLLD